MCKINYFYYNNNINNIFLQVKNVGYNKDVVGALMTLRRKSLIGKWSGSKGAHNKRMKEN